MSGSIHFFNEDITFILKQKRKVRTWLKTVITKSNFSYGDLNFIFCSDAYLLKINKNYLHHDFFTDIITFSNSTQKLTIAGDLFISIERVQENAHTLNIPFTDELHRVMVHGILHLMGYKDKSNADRYLMRKKENQMLKLMGTINPE